MTLRSALISALLYAGLLTSANTALAQSISAETVATAAAAREGSMRKLVFHDAPRPLGDVVFTDAAGAPVDLGRSDGKVRIVNFWATWCAPCREEKPALDALNKSMQGPDFEVIAIATGRNTLDAIKRFNDEVGVDSLTTYLDPRSKAARSAGVIGLPVSIIIDGEGNEIARLQGGADWSSDSARRIIRTLAGGGS